MNRAEAVTAGMLQALAEGRLALSERARLAATAANDPDLAREIQLALRLSDGSAELASNWVALAARAPAARASFGWRPALAMAASLGALALVTQLPGERKLEEAASQTASVVSVQAERPDRLSSPSFESGELFGGSFESGNG